MTDATLEDSLREDGGRDPAAVFERHRAELIAARRRRSLLLLVLFLLCLAASVGFTRFTPDRLLAGLPLIGDYLAETVPTLTSGLLLRDFRTEGSFAYWFWNLREYLVLLFQTINMALFATLIGTAVGFALSFPAARNLAPNRIVCVVARRLLEIARAVPDIVYALLFVWAFGVGPLAGVAAVALHSAGALGKLFSEVNENASPNPVEGVRASGGTWFDEMRYGVLPQVLPNFLSYALLRFEINIRSSSIIGFVGAGGIGETLYVAISRSWYTDVSAIVILILLTVVAVDLLSERLRHAAIGGEARA